MILDFFFHSVLRIKGFGIFELYKLKNQDIKDFGTSFISSFDIIKKSYDFCDRIYSTNDFKIHGPFLLEKLQSKDFVELDEEIFTNINEYILFASKGQTIYDFDKLKLIFTEFVPLGLTWYYMSFDEGTSVLDTTGLWDERYWIANPYCFYRSYIGYNHLGSCIIKLYLD